MESSLVLVLSIMASLRHRRFRRKRKSALSSLTFFAGATFGLPLSLSLFSFHFPLASSSSRRPRDEETHAARIYQRRERQRPTSWTTDNGRGSGEGYAHGACSGEIVAVHFQCHIYTECTLSTVVYSTAQTPSPLLHSHPFKLFCRAGLHACSVALLVRQRSEAFKSWSRISKISAALKLLYS